MSNILKTKNDLIILSDIINYINKNELSKSYLEEILKLLIPNNNRNYLINYNVKDKGTATAIFVPQSRCIKISLDKINKWLNSNEKDLIEFYKINDGNTLKSFLFLFMITHEIEHSYQYLIGEKIINTPNKMIQRGYKGIFDLLLPDNHIIPKPINETRNKIALFLYKIRQNFFILERNANIECTDLLCQLTLYMEREDIFQVFNNIRNSVMQIGYKENSMGSLDETYKKILLYDRYKKFYEEVNMIEEEKVRYGLNISEQTRQKVLRIK